MSSPMVTSLAAARMLSRTLRLLSPTTSCSAVCPSAAMLHTSSPQKARFKHRFTHKPFWRPAMSYRAQDDPVTWENRQFIEQMKKDSYVNTRVPVANGNGADRFVCFLDLFTLILQGEDGGQLPGSG